LEITGGETFLLKINVYETEKHVTLHSFYLWIQTIRTHAAKQMRWNASEAHKDYVNEEQNNKTQTLGKRKCGCRPTSRNFSKPCEVFQAYWPTLNSGYV